MRKRIKFYIHHRHFESLDAGSLGFWAMLKLVLLAVLQVVYYACYGVGLILLSLIKLPGQIIKVLVNLPTHLWRLHAKIRTAEFRRSLFIFTAFAVIVAVVMSSASLIAVGQQLKGRVLGTSDDGLNHLNEARNALEAQDISRAEQNFTAALASFQSSEQQLRSTSLVLQGLLSLVPQKQDADQLLEAAQLMTTAGQNATKAFAITQQLKIGPEGISGSDAPGQNLEQLRSLITNATTAVQRAAGLLGNVSPLILPSDKQPIFMAARDTLLALRSTLQTLQQGTDLLFDIAMGQKNILLIFQNNNELRPTGGFVGTIGSAHFDNGQIKQLDIRSVYDYDGQLQEKILPPQPMYAVNNRWYLRDANWFADFPTSASRLIAMYEKEGGETPDLVITMTPELVINLLGQTGPISLPQHGATLTPENFIEVVQTTTSVTYDKQLNQPKQLLADFFPVLLQKLSQTEHGGLLAMLSTVQQALFEKQILLYSRNQQLQSKIEAFNWGGKLRDSDRDYLNVVSANLGGTKTDRYLTRNITVNSSINPDGSIINTINYTVANPLPNQPGLENVSFIRFLVPQGSELQSSAGFSDVPLPRLEGDYQRDSYVESWEQTLHRDIQSGTYTGTENGKTLFANWLKVAGGETKTVTLSYKLPFSLRSSDRLSMLWQKQPGILNTHISYGVKFSGRKAVWQNFSSSDFSSDQQTYTGDLTKDLFLGLVLTK